MLGNQPRIKLLNAPTPLEFLPRLSDKLGRQIYIKRDDLTPVAFGGNKLRKLEFLAADALQQGADVLLTAGAIQSNHVRQTAAVAAKLGLKCMALLENPINSNDDAYLYGGNRQLSQLFGAELILIDKLAYPEAQLEKQAIYLEAQGFRPYTIIPGGSSVIGSLGYVDCAKEIAKQLNEQDVTLSSVVVASGSGGTQAGLSIGLEHELPEVELIGVAVSRSSVEQTTKVVGLRDKIGEFLGIESQQAVYVWDEYYKPGYAFPNPHGNDALQCLAELEAIVLDPVYTAKAMAGLIVGVREQRFAGDGAILFIHTGGAPGLFAYPSLR